MYRAFSRRRLKATKYVLLKQQLLVKSLVSTLAENGRKALYQGFLLSCLRDYVLYSSVSFLV